RDGSSELRNPPGRLPAASHVQRLDPDWVTSEDQFVAPRVEQRNGKDSIQPAEQLLLPLLPTVYEDLAVGTGLKHMSAALEIGSERLVVVDLAAERQPHRAVLVAHRLVSPSDVHDAQSSVCEHGGGRLV